MLQLFNLCLFGCLVMYARQCNTSIKEENQTMRKLSLLVLTAMLGIVLAACGGQTPPGGVGGTGATTPDALGGATTPDALGGATTPDALGGATTPDALGEATTPDAMTGADATETADAMTGTDATAEADTTPATGGMTGADATEIADAMTGTDATAGAGASGTATAGEGTIVDVAAQNGEFTTLISLVQAAGMEKTLTGDGPFTVFAPTDDAFAQLPPEALQALENDPDTLAQILQYHVAQGELMAADVATSTTIPTVAGQDLNVTADGSTVTLNDSVQVTTTDIEASNGVIHVIDQVLLPPDVQLPAGGTQ
jgi:uncharacterized surface protein with fasciclin (FAS1) repeats